MTMQARIRHSRGHALVQNRHLMQRLRMACRASSHPPPDVQALVDSWLQHDPLADSRNEVMNMNKAATGAR